METSDEKPAAREDGVLPQSSHLSPSIHDESTLDHGLSLSDGGDGGVLNHALSHFTSSRRVQTR